jgi:hypothetical protein
VNAVVVEVAEAALEAVSLIFNCNKSNRSTLFVLIHRFDVFFLTGRGGARGGFSGGDRFNQGPPAEVVRK